MELLIILLIGLLLANMLVVSSAAVIRKPMYLVSAAPERSQGVGCFPMVLGIFAVVIILGILVS